MDQENSFIPQTQPTIFFKSKTFLIVIIFIQVIILLFLGANLVLPSKIQVKPTPQLILPTIQPPSPTTTLSIDGMTNWTTYINNKFGFEIKYPENWDAAENIPKNIIDLDLSNRLYLLFSRNLIDERFKSDTLTHPWSELSIYIHNKKHSQQELDRNIRIKGQIIDGKEYGKYHFAPIIFMGLAANKSYPESEQVKANPNLSQIIFNYSDLGWTISFPISDYYGNSEPIFDQILSTFRFLDQK